MSLPFASQSNVPELFYSIYFLFPFFVVVDVVVRGMCVCVCMCGYKQIEKNQYIAIKKRVKHKHRLHSKNSPNRNSLKKLILPFGC